MFTDRRRQSSILDVRSFGEADCDTNCYLLVAKLRGRLSVNKKAAQKFDGKRLNLRKLNKLEIKEKYHIEIRNRFTALENLDVNEDVNRAWENIKESIKTSAKEDLGLHELKPVNYGLIKRV